MALPICGFARECVSDLRKHASKVRVRDHRSSSSRGLFADRREDPFVERHASPHGARVRRVGQTCASQLHASATAAFLVASRPTSCASLLPELVPELLPNSARRIGFPNASSREVRSAMQPPPTGGSTAAGITSDRASSDSTRRVGGMVGFYFVRLTLPEGESAPYAVQVLGREREHKTVEPNLAPSTDPLGVRFIDFAALIKDCGIDASTGSAVKVNHAHPRFGQLEPVPTCRLRPGPKVLRLAITEPARAHGSRDRRSRAKGEPRTPDEVRSRCGVVPKTGICTSSGAPLDEISGRASWRHWFSADVTDPLAVSAAAKTTRRYRGLPDGSQAAHDDRERSRKQRSCRSDRPGARRPDQRQTSI